MKKSYDRKKGGLGLSGCCAGSQQKMGIHIEYDPAGLDLHGPHFGPSVGIDILLNEGSKPVEWMRAHKMNSENSPVSIESGSAPAAVGLKSAP